MRDPHYMIRSVLSSCAIVPYLFLSLKFPFHYCCPYLLLDPLSLVDVANDID